MRTALEALAAVLGGTQSLHTNSFDEALALPTERAAKTALRTQQVIGHETGATHTVDPLAGSYYLEALTNEVEDRARSYIDRIDRMGGAVAAIEAGFYQDEIHEAAYAMQQGIESGARVVVGVNRFEDPQEHGLELQRIAEEGVARQVERVRDLRASREGGRRSRPRGRRGGGSRDRQPPPADAARLACARDPRRSVRRAADRLRRVPPRLAEQPKERVEHRGRSGDEQHRGQPSQAGRAQRRDRRRQAPEPDEEFDREGRGLAHRGAG